MVVKLPPKIFRILGPVIRGYKGMAREVKFDPLINHVFKSYFGCTVEERKNRMFKVTPPQVGCGSWYWNRVPFFIHKPVNGIVGREQLYKQQKDFKSLYDWDNKTIQCERGGSK